MLTLITYLTLYLNHKVLKFSFAIIQIRKAQY